MINDIKDREEWIDLFEKYKPILTINQQQIFYLYYIEDLSLSEISHIVATTRSSVHDALTKAKKKLEAFKKNN